ncbi:hypothetical protein NVP1170O_022 [Vibrio phage 1.170.O._10N.261.52.C3]|nr:hypothetical protein NVP1170O_022 [Vibrio phage 1.170.O._10N.261.52.C3]
MAVLNKAELDAQRESTYRRNKIPKNFERNSYELNQTESLDNIAGAISDGVVENIPVTDTITKLTTFNTNDTSENEVFRPDQANDKITLKGTGVYFVTLRFQGRWGVGEDLTFHVYINGVPNPITPFDFSAEGSGNNDPKVISITRFTYVVTTPMLVSGEADIEVFVESTTGTFSLDQDKVNFGVELSPLTFNSL